MGTMPIIMASAVINHRAEARESGVERGLQGRSPGFQAFACAKLTTRMLLAVATPTLIMAPISAGTLKVVCVTNRNITIPAMAAGSAVMMMNGSSQDWKFTTISA